ncbi:MAG: two-component regulator propeller domain-containing protein [Pedobacter sp.]
MLNQAVLKTICLIAVLILGVHAGYTQQQKIDFTSLNTKNGLSSNSVNAILKDRYGLLWFATEDGLNRFDGANFTVYKHRSDDLTGLQANDIKALHEDRMGNLWIGSSGGSLSLYNRSNNSFTNFPAAVGPNSLSSDVVKSICSDVEGYIWVATYGGLDVFDPRTKISRKLKIPRNENGIDPSLLVSYLYEDSDNRMWIGTNIGLYLYNRVTHTFKHFQNSKSDLSSLSGDLVTSIAEDSDGQIWIGTKTGLSLFLPGTNSFKNIRHIKSDSKSLTSNVIQSLAANDDSQLWIGTDEGLHTLNIKTGEMGKFMPDHRNIYSLTSKSIKYVYIDNQGVYWLAVYRAGINKYDTNLNLFHLKQSNMYDHNGLNASIVTSFAESADAKIYVGTDGGGLNVFDRKTELFRRIKMPEVNEQNSTGLAIMTMKMTRAKKLYIGTYGTGLFVMDVGTEKTHQFQRGDRSDQLNSNEIFCIKEDKSGQIWIGTNGGGVNVMNQDHKVVTKYFNEPKGKKLIPANNFIRFIEEDNEGNMWIGSYGSGIAVFNIDTKKFTHFNKANSGLPSNVSLSILKDRQGDIWVGTLNGGLSLYDKNKRRFLTFSEKDALNSATVYAIVEGPQGKIWVSTNQGISSFDRKTRKFTNYTIYNGIQNNNFISGAGFKSSDGEIFFGGAEGFNYFNPKDFKKNKHVPAVILTDLKIDNNSVSPSADGALRSHISAADEINLGYGQNFMLHYSGLNYTANPENKYAYWLEGFDKKWTNAGTVKSVSYTNLDPGEYVFHVKAANNDGIWNAKETTIKISVRPPFWRTIYAYVLYALAVSGAILYTRHLGIRKLKLEFAAVQEKVRVEQMLEQERKEGERLRELDQLKIKFLTDLSHEFRTPLSLIMGPVEKLINEDEEGVITAPLNMVKRNARRLLNLVNQILDLRKIEKRELKLDLREADVISFIKEVLESFHDLSETKMIQLKFSSKLKYLSTAFDQSKIERVLFNLLSNAFKFTAAGGTITVTIEECPRTLDSSQSILIIRIIDTGIGIPVENTSKIFDRFFQVDNTASVLNQGSGIGLSIAKEFVDMHGGSIVVESEPGIGSTFAIELPVIVNTVSDKLNLEFTECCEMDKVVHVVATLDTHETSTEMQSILIVEDNEDYRFYLKDCLKPFYKVYEASNGQEGWQKTLANHPNIIVSDINMPFMNGIELCIKVKSDKRTNHIPIVLLTALTGEEQQIKGLETGANDYLSKPFNFEILNAKIRNLLLLNRTLKNTYTKQIKVQTPEVLIESYSDRLLNKVVLYIEENLNNPKLSVEDLSKHVGMSRGSLYHKILELTGISPVEFIRSVKLDKATVLLEKSDLNVSQVAYTVGFATPNYFAKSFKAKYNMQPSEYINQRRKIYAAGESRSL